MSTQRMNLFGNTQQNGILKLSKNFRDYQHKVRNIAFYDGEEEYTKDRERLMRKQYPLRTETLDIDENFKVKFESMPDYETGYGHLNVVLLDNNCNELLRTVGISDGLSGNRVIEFNPNSCYDMTELGKKILGDKIIKIEVEL